MPVPLSVSITLDPLTVALLEITTVAVPYPPIPFVPSPVFGVTVVTVVPLGIPVPVIVAPATRLGL